MDVAGIVGCQVIKIASVNNALKAKGYNAELVQGDGYFYFVGDEADEWYSSSVSVYRLNHLSLEGWIAEYEAKRKEYAERRAMGYVS